MRKLLAGLLTISLLMSIIIIPGTFVSAKDNDDLYIVLKSINGMNQNVYLSKVQLDDSSQQGKITYVFEELLSKKYETSELFSEIPNDTKLISTSLEKGNLELNFNNNFIDNLTGNHNVGFILDSILETAFQFNNIKSVTIKVDGEGLGIIQGYDFSIPFSKSSEYDTKEEKNKRSQEAIINGIIVPDPVIVIDPGHGGTDPGAVASDGTKEKDINLAVALKLRTYLENWGATVYMTRTTDINPSYSDRYGLANDLNADIFISVHHNGSTNTSTRGTTAVYPNNHDITLSQELAVDIHNYVLQVLPQVRYPYIDERNLAVLRNTTMPAVITETGYLTNSTDLAYIKIVKWARCNCISNISWR